MSKTNWVLLILILVLGIFYYKHPGKPQEGEANPEKRLFAEAKKSDVKILKVEKLSHPPLTREYARENGVWVLHGETPMVMRTFSMGSLVKSLVELEWVDDMQEDGNVPKRADFGLDKPSFRLTMTDKNGVSRSLLVGAKTPDERGYYVSLSDTAPIYGTNVALSELLDGTAESLRENSPIVFEPSTANKIEIQAPSGPLEVGLAKPREQEEESAQDDGIETTDLNEEWKITRPEAAKADGAKVRDFISNWRNVKLARFMKGSEGVDFSKPLLSVAFHVDQQKDPFRLVIGGPVAGKKDLYYAHRFAPDEYMVLEMPDSKLLEPNLKSFLQRHLFDFPNEDVVRLEATLDGVKFSAKKDGDNWKVTPALAEAEKQSLPAADLVYEVRNAEWSEQPADSALPKEWKERGSIELWDKKQSLARLVLGPVGPQGQGAYVRDGQGKTYLLADDPGKRWSDIKARLEGKQSPTPTPEPPKGIVLPNK